MDEEPQFDCALGGVEEVPPSINLAKFVACRSQEIQIMKNSLLVQSGTKMAFQTIPKHMRRRAMSHNAKRLPRRLRQIHLNQMKKSGMPAKQKRPSRKYRRRPRNLTEEYTRRSNKKYRWLQTHIWHAKRFHMVEKWGFKLPYRPCDKAFRACYRAMSQHCLLQDMSYFRCIEISGEKEIIICNVNKLCKSDCGLSIGARAFINGNREGEIMLYEIDESQRAIGSVNYQWKLNFEEQISKLWLWVHPAFYNTVEEALTQCFNNTGCAVEEISEDLGRFRLTGPLSNSVLHDALVAANVEDITTQQSYMQEYITSDISQTIKNHREYWTNIKDVMCTSYVSPHLILPLIVKDPRLSLPKKRIKSVSEFKNCATHSTPNTGAVSPLWDPTFRKRANEYRMSDTQIADLQRELLVPGSDLSHNETFIPIILIQKPGSRRDNVGFGGGWDIILPRIWAKTFWVAIVMRGARVGGLRESNSILFEMGKSQFLEPDTKAGTDEELLTTKQYVETFFKRPPNKRTNYNKFKIASPFSCNWSMLTKEWNNIDDYFVLKDRKVLNLINDFLHSKTRHQPDYPKNCLIPVKFECEKRGCPSQFAIICLPKIKNDFKGLVEPICEDKFQLERKELRKSHISLLKKLRKQRKMKAKTVSLENYREILSSYTKKIRALWLPEPTSIRYSCCREVIGFVTKGGFSFSLGKSSATGYIASGCLPALTKFRNKVLCRNTNSRQYKSAKLSVIID